MLLMGSHDILWCLKNNVYQALFLLRREQFVNYEKGEVMSRKTKLLIPFISIFVIVFVNVQIGLSANSTYKCEQAYKKFSKGDRGPGKVIKECEDLANKGRPEAQLVLGKMYFHSRNPDPDINLAIEYLEACSSQTKDKKTQSECQKELEKASAGNAGGAPPEPANSGATVQVAKVKNTPPPSTKGPKKRLAVLDFENKVADKWWGPEANIEERLTEMVITALVNTNMFIIVERESIQNVIREQDFGSSGRVRAGTEAKIGNILGAQVLVKGAVTEFSQKDSGGAGGIALKGIVLGGKSSTGHVAIDIRLIDSTTSQILQSHRAEGKIKSKGLMAAGAMKGIALGGGTFSKTSLGKATREAVTKARKYIVGQMEDQVWSSKIIKADSNKVYISGGADMNIGNGLQLTVYSLGEALVDPDTGIALGQTMSKAGTVKIIQVDPKFSIATIIEGGNFKRGDLVKLLQ